MNHPETASYYSDLTTNYLKYAEGTYGWHYGIWDPGISTNVQALLRSNERLVKNTELNSKSQLLDVGCGVGGFAVWAAMKYGCNVTGITICPEHAEFASTLAKEKCVSNLCKFTVMNMDDLSL